VRSRVDGEIVTGRLIDDVQDLPAWDMDAARSAVALSIEMLVVEEIDPMRAVVSTRGGMEMEGGHSTVKFMPSEVITGRLFRRVEIEASHAPSAAVSTIAQLIARQEDGEVTIAVLVHWVRILRHSRGRWGEDEDRRGEGQAHSRPPHFPDTYAVPHRGPFLVVVGRPRAHFRRVRPDEPNLQARHVLATATYARKNGGNQETVDATVPPTCIQASPITFPWQWAFHIRGPVISHTLRVLIGASWRRPAGLHRLHRSLPDVCDLPWRSDARGARA
jgi:hypothetical protein